MSSITASYLGHKSRCFDIKVKDVSPESNDYYLLSSSEDGRAILWLYSSSSSASASASASSGSETKSRKPLFIFKHSNDSEVLRSVFIKDKNTFLTICTCGADGLASIWTQDITLEHSTRPPLSNMTFTKIKDLKHHDDQIYACESLGTGELITAAGDKINIWNYEKENENKPYLSLIFYDSKYSLSAASSLAITDKTQHPDISQSHFGGDRNPGNIEYVFDAKCSPTNNFHIAVVTSECMLHLINLQALIIASQHDDNNDINSINCSQGSLSLKSEHIR